ncbi:MAG TPA: 50S ribosomal protein L37ae [Candidatus Thermoplasmatota archaeon]
MLGQGAETLASGLRKSGSVGRFGARYGVKIRRGIEEVERLQKARYKCPRCEFEAVKRYATGVWRCRHCGLKFAGGAYTPVPSEVSAEQPAAAEEEAGGGTAAARAGAQE